MSRRSARECALQLLYEIDFNSDQKEEEVIKQRGINLLQSDYTYYSRLIDGIKDNNKKLDPIIEKYLKEGWSLYRISPVDRAILRIAAYEMFYEEDTPNNAIANEAVEIAKRFSSFESARFINGVLGQILDNFNEIAELLKEES